MTTEVTAALNEIQAKKEALLSRIQKLEEAQDILCARGIDDRDLYYEIRAMHEEYNALIDEAKAIKASERRGKYFDRKAKSVAAYWRGVNAYWEAHDDHTYIPVCEYKTKYEKQSWLKGLKSQENQNGCIGQPVFAA
jgi:hypothetical protein